MKKYTSVNKNKLVKIIICGTGIIGLLIIVLNLLRKTKEPLYSQQTQVSTPDSKTGERGIGTLGVEAKFQGNSQQKTDSSHVGKHQTDIMAGGVIDNGDSSDGLGYNGYGSQPGQFPKSQPSSIESQENRGTDGNELETEIVMKVTLSGPPEILTQLNIK